jgi:hypothetical protein
MHNKVSHSCPLNSFGNGSPASEAYRALQTGRRQITAAKDADTALIDTNIAHFPNIGRKVMLFADIQDPLVGVGHKLAGCRTGCATKPFPAPTPNNVAASNWGEGILL